ncbi:P-loop containing nucleoside triphosphate hydrolase protein [Dichomitus squalens]|uniref:DNA 3'-5' helicase n=1 Tax=Dichomitus squalens TaxID=114155 RepID=A0A4Q9N406_9APHY|nr:P-loop containing nucleoside triphosphate hydrolase protein [Dichomitus squalens]
MADNINELLKELNPAQLQAVQHPPQIPLQILAGPGSGKTKVLTMRIAHLITNCYHPPWSICAVTFTNKAANEMRGRLVKLIGKDNTAQIRMGTFHALCCNFLRRYARYVGIEGNFTVCDADESKKIVAKLLKPHQGRLKGRNLTLKEATVLSMISKLKAKGMTADDALAKVAEANARPAEERIRRRMERGANDNANLLEGDLGEIIAAIYKEYEKTLREANSLDFDDLLVFGVRMFAGHKKASAWCRHVLVDEYQDTNTTQYELMRHIAQASKCVTIVGDPDQSIYGWRSAEITNLANMQRDFPNTQQIYLETNYRSTASILAASMAIISQDKNRIQKTLNTSHPKGPLPVLRAFPMEQVEAGFIAAEIKRIIAFTGGMLTWSDFVVLLRYNAHSRVIEAALQKEGIPNRVLAGHKFFERMEVKDVLAYLQLIDNPAFVPAFTRVVNVPSRTVGEKTVAELLHRASQLKLPPLTVVERIVEGKIPDIKPPVKRKLSSFVDTLRDLRRYAHEGMSPTKLITALVDLVGYQEHLRKTQPDHESRWENVQELINFASEVENGMDAKAGRRMEDAAERAHEELWGDGLGEWDRDQVEEDGEGDTPLRHFLQASMLSTDTETPEDEKSKDKVTISTCHAAKGLEWAVVMIPAVEDGVFPSARSEDTEEERRLLYVACTRAQGLLYLTHATSRMIAGEQKPTDLSPFIAEVRGDHQTRGVFSEELPSLPGQDRTTICKVLGRPLPDETEVKRRVAEFTQTGRHPVWGMNAPFRDVPGVPHNGYAVPARYPGQQAQAGQQSWGGGGGGQRLGGVPGSIVEPDPDGLEAALGTAGPVKRDPDGPQEPPMFVASSILHFNNAHRAGIVQSAQQASTSAQLSNQAARAHAKLPPTPSSSRKGSANLQAPLASSSSRVVNTASSPASRGNIRDWFGQQDVDSQGLDLSSKAKGKARAAEAYLAMSSSKATPTPAKPASRVPARPLGMTASVARVKMEKTEPTLVKTEHLEPSQLRLKREPSLEEPPLGLTQRVRPAAVQGKSISGRIKSERFDLELPSGRQPLAEATPASLARSSTFSPRSVPGTGRVVTVKPPSTPSPFSSGQSLPSSSSASSSKSPSAAPVEIIDVDALDDPPVKPMTTKRRLGMGRATRGYANKKFKPLMPNGP